MISQLYKIDFEFIANLYREYQADLSRAKRELSVHYADTAYAWYDQVRCEQNILNRIARFTYARLGFPLQGAVTLQPMLADLSAEINYLLVRKFKPQTLVEISPAGGWSTVWFLTALRDNNAGRLYSYDIFDTATKTVPKRLSENRWNFILGDVRQQKLPDPIDYLFIDCDHTAQFAEWYLKNILTNLKPNTPVAIDDIFFEPGCTYLDPGERNAVLRWLKEQAIEPFSASQYKDKETFNKLNKIKNELYLNNPIHTSHIDSMIFFLR